jgi:hypothetical protein
VACLVGLVLSASAEAKPRAPRAAAAPQGVKAFLLRADEQAAHTFSRTPSFAWSPVPGAVRYEFELSSSKSFADNSIVYSDATLTSPVAAIPIALPWSTGKDYSLFVHVRAVTRRAVSPWSTPYGFSMRWGSVAQPILPSYAGLLRWTTVSGATGYQVWEVDTGKMFATLTNVADEREFYTFHQAAPWISSVRWRVRAIRNVTLGAQNGMPATPYGPWSPIYTSVNPPFAVGGLSASATVSDVVSDAITQQPHRLMPAFVFAGNTDMYSQAEELYHVYVFSDSDCLNMVYKGSIVGSPAWAPRVTGALAMPNSLPSIAAARTAYLTDGDPGTIFTYDKQRVTPTDVGGATPYPPIDLWDVDWPNGRYYWTVMPVAAVTSQDVTTTLTAARPAGSPNLLVGSAAAFAAGDALDVGTGSSKETVIATGIVGNTLSLSGTTTKFHAAGETVAKPAGVIEYHDTELPQESCAAGRVGTFGKTSEPALTSATAAPFVTGLSPVGKLFSAKTARPAVYGAPLVAWQPALGAVDYEIQWSSTPGSFPKANDKVTQATSFVLPVKAGTWYYRVRGLDYAVPNKPQMSWSDVVTVRVTKPRYRVVR